MEARHGGGVITLVVHTGKTNMPITRYIGILHRGMWANKNGKHCEEPMHSQSPSGGFVVRMVPVAELVKGEEALSKYLLVHCLFSL